MATDTGGINTDELEKALESKVGLKSRELTDRRPFWGMLYLISSIHNPTGVTLTEGMCIQPIGSRKLLAAKLAKFPVLLVIADLLLFVTERCKRIVQLARKYNLLVVTDDVYNMLYFGDKPPHRLFQFDNK